MFGYKGLSEAQGRSLRRSPEGLAYRLKMTDPQGRVLGDEQVRAHTDEHAIATALRRLSYAAIVEVWSHSRWVGQVQRAIGAH
jgi:hypothetical protein